MRYVMIVSLLSFMLLFTACSYSTDFVIVNESTNPIEVQYKIRKSLSEPLLLTGPPAKIGASQIRAGDRQWRNLSDTEYRVDRDSRIVSVTVMPDEALRVENVLRVGGQVNDADEIESFAIEEITITGTRGEIRFQGEQARKSFMPESNRLSTLTYK